jgi:glucose-1-phosphate cytidylyltransferase
VVNGFREKPQGDGAWINGGFFVLQPKVIDFIDGDASVWEAEPLEQIAQAGQLAAFRHEGFWQPMDTLRDKKLLEDLWAGGRAPWKVWRDGDPRVATTAADKADRSPPARRQAGRKERMNLNGEAAGSVRDQ